MLRVAICEDAGADADQIIRMLTRYQENNPQLQIEHFLFQDAADLLDAVKCGRHFDLYLLDIVMPGMDGIQLARALREEGSRSMIIYLTASSEYAVEAFSVRAVNYLLKPVADDVFFAALDDAIGGLGSQIETFTVVQTVEGGVRVALSRIICVEVTGHVLHYTLCDGRTLRSKVLRVSFDKTIADLREAGFMRPHQSFAVNPAWITGFTTREFQMANGMRIPISRLRYPEIKAAYMRFLAQRGGKRM